jgi:hypothetical protein
MKERRPVSETYAFIDGAYFREVTREIVQKMFGIEAENDYRSLFGRLNDTGGSPLRRVFFCDCLMTYRRKENLIRGSKRQSKHDQLSSI